MQLRPGIKKRLFRHLFYPWLTAATDKKRLWLHRCFFLILCAEALLLPPAGVAVKRLITVVVLFLVVGTLADSKMKGIESLICLLLSTMVGLAMVNFFQDVAMTSSLIVVWLLNVAAVFAMCLYEIWSGQKAVAG